MICIDSTFIICHAETNLPELYLKIHLAPHSKHFLSVIKTSVLMLYREMIAFFFLSEIYIKHTKKLCGI